MMGMWQNRPLEATTVGSKNPDFVFMFRNSNKKTAIENDCRSDLNNSPVLTVNFTAFLN